MHITSILDERYIATGLRAENKDEALNAVINLVSSSPRVRDIEKVRTAVVERERLMSTGVGYGFAIPHGKTDAIDDIVAAFATLAEPLDFDSLDNQPVRMIFLLVGRESQVGAHLKLLSRISRLMNNENFRNRLLAAEAPADILALFLEEEGRYFEK